jgi:hypothetical protein
MKKILGAIGIAGVFGKRKRATKKLDRDYKP